jgi:DNA-binding XRE family transcriptional regulator
MSEDIFVSYGHMERKPVRIFVSYGHDDDDICASLHWIWVGQRDRILNQRVVRAYWFQDHPWRQRWQGSTQWQPSVEAFSYPHNRTAASFQYFSQSALNDEDCLIDCWSHGIFSGCDCIIAQPRIPADEWDVRAECDGDAGGLSWKKGGGRNQPYQAADAYQKHGTALDFVSAFYSTNPVRKGSHGKSPEPLSEHRQYETRVAGHLSFTDERPPSLMDFIHEITLRSFQTENITMRNKWNNRNYLTIKAVGVGKDNLSIEFANGDLAQISCSAVTPPGATQIRWTESHISPDRLHITVPAQPRDIEIVWHVARRLTDPEFAGHMAELAAKQAEHVGARLRELRKQRGLTQAEVAGAAKIEPGNLSRIENGHFDVSTSTLWKVLAAMGYSPADLAPREVAETDNSREWARS